MYLVLNVLKRQRKSRVLHGKCASYVLAPKCHFTLPPATSLFFHSSQPHLNVWLKAVKSWPGKRDEKGMNEDRKKV